MHQFGIHLIVLIVIQNNIPGVQSNRVNLDVLSNIWSNIIYISNLVFDSIKLYPKFLHIIFIIAFLTLLYVYEIKNKKTEEFFKAVVIVIAFYLSSLILGLIYTELIRRYNGRVFGSVGAIISALIIFLYTNTKIFEDNLLKKITIGLSIIYLITILGNTLYVTHEFQKNNETDKELAIKIATEIERYEQENNTEITKMAVNYVFDETYHEFPVMNQSKKTLGLYGPSELKLYTNKNLEKIMFEDEIKEQYFKQNEEKILCIEDAVYVQIKI